MDNKMILTELLSNDSKNHLWSMDTLHAKMLYNFIKQSQIHNVIEVGCAYGVSTSYIIEAMGGKGLLTLIDINFTPEVQSLLKAVRDQDSRLTVECFTCRSTHIQNGEHILTKNMTPETIILLDGDHSVEVVKQEIDIILSNKCLPAAIILHDSGTVNGLDGPRYAEKRLQKQGYVVVKDEEERPGMRTSRGLSICVFSLPQWGGREELLTIAKSSLVE